MDFRDYRQGDFETLWRLDQLCFVPDIAYSRPELRQFLALKDAITIVADEGKAVVGFVLVHKRGSRGHIITIDVHPEHRRRKIGDRLIAVAERRLAKAGADSIFLEVAVDNAAAIGFYQRHDYKQIEHIPEYYNGELDAYRMGKELKAAVS